MRKIKIAIVYDAIYPYVKGGTEKRNYELSKRLVQSGFEVHIYGMQWWKGSTVIKKDGVYLHGICSAIPLYTIEGRRSIWQAIYFGLNCFKLLNEDFDILDVNHMPYFSLYSTRIVAYLKGKKLYATWNEVWSKAYWEKYLGKLGTIAYFIDYFSSKMPDEIIAVSENTKSKLITDLHVKKQISVVTNGIDVDLISKVKPSRQKSDVIFAGRLLSHKNVDLLITAIHLLKNKYPNITCVIVGKGPEEQTLKKLVDKLLLQKNVIFYDFLEKHTDLYALMKASKIFAFPSNREGFGIAALEANAAGIPILTSSHKDNATKDLIKKGKNGDTFQLEESKIAEKIKKYLSLENHKEDFFEISKSYDWNNITNILLKVYNV